MEGAAQLVSIVGEVVGEEYRQLRRVGVQVAELSDELDSMNAILRMLSDADEGAVDHFIRVWMKQVRELAYDAEDCVHLYIFRIRCRPRDRLLVWPKAKRILSTLFPRRRLAREIEALRARAVVISERQARYGVSREALSRSTPRSLAAPAPVPVHALSRLQAANDPDHLVGITKQANKLADKVKKAVSASELELKVFSVVGFGGLGKTTLAMEVCRLLETEFQRQAQVSVSQAFDGSKDLKGLLKRVLEQIVKPKTSNEEGIKEVDHLVGIDKMDVQELTNKLKQVLKDTRYLIMVDDVWTVAAWDAIRSKLPEDKNGSRIIVTTRIETVVLEVMVSTSLEANFVSLLGGPYQGMSYGSIRRLSIHGGEVEESVSSPSNNIAAASPQKKKKSNISASHGKKNDIDGMKMEHVRSLSMFGPEDHLKVLNRLDEFRLLRVLDLEDCTGMKNKHLSHVCRMYLLRFLSLRGTRISDMPPETGKLENLETLDVRDTYLNDLPETVSELEKLEHLYISNKENWNCWIARPGIRKMKALRTINEVAFESDAVAAEGLGELQQLSELRITLKISNSSPSYEDLRKKIARSLSRIYSLRWLNVSDLGHGSDIGPVKTALNFLNDIDPPPRLLQHLRISGTIGKVPDWFRSLNYLVELVIANTHFVGEQLLGPVCKLPNLKHMRFEANYYKDKELVAKSAHTFPALKDLHVNFSIEAMETLRFQDESMIKLETLSVFFSNRQSKRVLGIKNLASLKEVVLEGKKGNPAIDHAVEQVKAVNEKRQMSNQLKVALKYV